VKRKRGKGEEGAEGGRESIVQASAYVCKTEDKNERASRERVRERWRVGNREKGENEKRGL
jgi:hypothetical protein